MKKNKPNITNNPLDNCSKLLKNSAITFIISLSQQYNENYLVQLYIDGTYFANVIQKEHHLSRGDLRVVWSHEIGGAFL